MGDSEAVNASGVVKYASLRSGSFVTLMSASPSVDSPLLTNLKAARLKRCSYSAGLDRNLQTYFTLHNRACVKHLPVSRAEGCGLYIVKGQKNCRGWEKVLRGNKEQG